MSNQSLNYVATVLDWIESNSSRKAKESGLRTLAGSHEEIRTISSTYFKAALDWYLIYHFGYLPEIDESKCVEKNTWQDFVNMLNDLQERKYGRDVDRVMNVLHGYSPNVAKWLRRCVLKNLDCGVASTTVNKVWPGLCRTFECQLADTVSDIESLTYPLLVEPKIDGVRALCFITPQYAEFYSRGGQLLSNVDHIAQEAASLFYRNHGSDEAIVLDGELFNGALNTTLSATRSSKSIPDPNLVASLRYHIFDAVGLQSWKDKICRDPQIIRSLFLKQAMSGGELIIPVESKEVKSSHDVEFLYEQALARGDEGLMLKSVSGLYNYKRSSDWIKYKPHDIETFEICGTYEGEGRLAGTLGGIIVRMKNGDTCRVGGGYKDLQRQDMWGQAQLLVGKKARVKFKEKSVDGKLREPVFLNLED